MLALTMDSPAHPVVPPPLIADIAGGDCPGFNEHPARSLEARTGYDRISAVPMTDNLFSFALSAIGNGLAAVPCTTEIFELALRGRVAPVIDSVLPFTDAMWGLQHVREGRTSGRVLLQVR